MMTRRSLARGVLFLSLGLTLASMSSAQTPAPEAAAPVPANSASGVAWAARSLAALRGEQGASGIVLTGAATWIAGSETETGTARLEAAGTDRSRVELQFPGGGRIEVRGLSHHSPRGAESATGALAAAAGVPEGAVRPRALHNNWTSAVWFFPALGPLATTGLPETRVADLGQEQLALTAPGGSPGTRVAVEHLRFSRWDSRQSPPMTAEIAGLSACDVYIDPATLLPVAMRFMQHPENDLRTDIPVEVRYSDYRPTSGLAISRHIERWRSGVLELAIEVESAEILSTAPDESRFALAGGDR